MQTSVIICTRNRGSLIELTLQNIFAGTRIPDELIVIDQSDNDSTRVVVERFASDHPAVRYIATETRGLSLARNVGLNAASGEVLAFTDDDVLVYPDWLERIEKEFTQYPDLALHFGTVIPPDTYDYKTEFIPYTILPTRRPVQWHDSCALMGMGANMTLRRRTMEIVGGFDPVTGPGTPLVGNDDREYALRVLCGLPGSPGLRVHLSDDIRVVHHAGARRGEEYHQFVHRMNGTGEGMYWAYMLRRQFRPQYAFKCIQQSVGSIGNFLKDIARGKRPAGVKTYLFYLGAFWKGMLAPNSFFPVSGTNLVSQPRRTMVHSTGTTEVSAP